MEHLFKYEYLQIGDSAIFNCDTECNCWLMDEYNYNLYKSNRDFKALGGGYKRFPVQLSAPSIGKWYAVIDLGGYSANIRYTIGFLKG